MNMLPQDLELLFADLGKLTKEQIERAIAPFEKEVALLEKAVAELREQVELLRDAHRRAAKSANLVDWPSARRSA